MLQTDCAGTLSNVPNKGLRKTNRHSVVSFGNKSRTKCKNMVKKKYDSTERKERGVYSVRFVYMVEIYRLNSTYIKGFRIELHMKIERFKWETILKKKKTITAWNDDKIVFSPLFIGMKHTHDPVEPHRRNPRFSKLCAPQLEIHPIFGIFTDALLSGVTVFGTASAAAFSEYCGCFRWWWMWCVASNHIFIMNLHHELIRL